MFWGPHSSSHRGLPLSSNRVPHQQGFVEPGLYVSGWLKRGPQGIIASNIGDAQETAGGSGLLGCIFEVGVGDYVWWLGWIRKYWVCFGVFHYRLPWF